MRLGRIRHRASEVNSSTKEVDIQIQQSNGDARKTDSERLPLNNQANNGVTSQSYLNTKTLQSNELEDGDSALLDNEPIPQSFNLFGNSIISKQG